MHNVRDTGAGLTGGELSPREVVGAGDTACGPQADSANYGGKHKGEPFLTLVTF